MSLPMTSQEQSVARAYAKGAAAVQRMLRQQYLAQGVTRSLAWCSGMTAAIELVTSMIAQLESAAPPDYTTQQAENMEWQRIAGLLMERLGVTHVVLEQEWMTALAMQRESAEKGIIAHQKPSGLHVLLLPMAEAQAYLDLSNKGEV